MREAFGEALSEFTITSQISTTKSLSWMLFGGCIETLPEDETNRQMQRVTPTQPCRCIELYIRNTNVKQCPKILIGFLLINNTDNGQGRALEDWGEIY